MVSCYECGRAVQGNLSAEHEVACGTCTMIKAMRIQRLEQESGMEIRRTRDIPLAETKRDEVLSRYSGEDLRAARRKARLSQVRLALLWGTSQPFISQMEDGTRPLTFEAVKFISRNERLRGDLSAVYVQKLLEKCVENKGVRDLTEKPILDPSFSNLLMKKALKTNKLRGVKKGVRDWRRWDRKKNPISWEDLARD